MTSRAGCKRNVEGEPGEAANRIFVLSAFMSCVDTRESSPYNLDEYFTAGPALNMVKIDVEGAESQVLAGMTRILREVRPVLFIEFHDDRVIVNPLRVSPDTIRNCT